MTSSMQGPSGNDGDDEQQKQVQEIQKDSCALENNQPIGALTQPSMPFCCSEAAHTLGQAMYPNLDFYYGSTYAACTGQPMYYSQLVGGQQFGMLLPGDTMEEPVYVNAKQYNAILRRRRSRAKAESENKSIKGRKPYLHESRHLHALKRARGTGGRFLNVKPEDGGQSLPTGGAEEDACAVSYTLAQCGTQEDDEMVNDEENSS